MFYCHLMMVRRLRLKIKFLSMCLITFFSISFSAGICAEEAGFKSKIRPYFTKIIGMEWTNKLLGKKEIGITLPKIPEVSASATTVTKDFSSNKKKLKFKEEDLRRYNTSFVRELFFVTRNIKANSDEISRWMNVIEQSGSREGVYRALVLDRVYGGLENFDSKINSRTVEFTLEFMGKFLGKTVGEDELKKINFYTLKRILTENSLSILDFYLDNNEDNFYRWYAVFSGDIAEKYPDSWKNKVRKIKRRISHKKWAESMPIQHVKSEVIIKIHKLMNKLNEVKRS